LTLSKTILKHSQQKFWTRAYLYNYFKIFIFKIFLSEESAEEELERLIQRSTAGKEK